MSVAIILFDPDPTRRLRLKAQLSSTSHPISMVSTHDQLITQLRGRGSPLVLLHENQASTEVIATLHASAATIIALIGSEGGLRALQIGADAVIRDDAGPVLLQARIRAALRHRPQPPQLTSSVALSGHKNDISRMQVAIVAERPATAVRWKHLLIPHLDCQLTVLSPEEVLPQVSADNPAQLYLMSPTFRTPGDGLHLMAEIGARPVCRDSALVALAAGAQDPLAAVALDLGACDVIDSGARRPAQISQVALVIRHHLQRLRRRARARRQHDDDARMATLDPLTGLLNRRGLDRALANSAMSERAKTLTGTGMIALDIDHFKSVNDTHGHGAGDEVLREVAHCLRRNLPEGAVLARMGGEEFLAVLPDRRVEETGHFAEVLCDAIRNHTFAIPAPVGPGWVIGLTVSAGVAHKPPGPERVQFWIDAADHALMTAKRQGRDRVRIADCATAA